MELPGGLGEVSGDLPVAFVKIVAHKLAPPLARVVPEEVGRGEGGLTRRVSPDANEAGALPDEADSRNLRRVPETARYRPTGETGVGPQKHKDSTGATSPAPGAK